MLPDLSPNWLAVIVATVLNMALGALWYGPLFGKQWMDALGKTMEEFNTDKAAMGRMYAVSAAMAFVASIGLNDVIKMAGGVDIAEGALLGFAVAVAFVATTQVPSLLFERRSTKVVNLFVAYQAVWFVLAGALFAAWP